MYKWSNKNRLNKLKVEGADNVLEFYLGDEQVTVSLKGRDIEKVSHYIKGEVTIIKEPFKLIRGNRNSEREVHHYLKPGGPSKTLRLGITHHTLEGGWSSTPHPFELKPEKGFEEVFFYLLDGPAIQISKGKWPNGSKAQEVWEAHDHTWACVPMGEHPIVGLPDARVSYVWCYNCIKKGWEKI